MKKGLALVLFFLTVLLPSASRSMTAAASSVVTPLEQSGLTPLWRENFTNGSIDRMQFVLTSGDTAALTSFVMPGVVYLGKEGSLLNLEQEINNFKSYSGEPLAHTIEFDVLSPITGNNGRVSLRPQRRGDMVHIKLAMNGDQSQVNVRFLPNGNATTIPYAELSGPSRGWTHVTLSYEQIPGSTTLAHYVIALNEEVHEIQGASGIVNPDWQTAWTTESQIDGWSIEHASAYNVMGKYVANVRAYENFIPLTEVQTRLQGKVSAYTTSLADPRTYAGSTKLFKMDKPLTSDGPNTVFYSEALDPLKIRFDGTFSSAFRKITSFVWNFGDGTTGSGRMVDHTFTLPGTYNVTLTTTTVEGLTDSRTISVSTLLTNTPTDTPVAPTNTPTFTNTPTDAPTDTPTPTNTRTNTPVPLTDTPTDTPTNTPVPPTDTPVAPTNTPTNTPTPSDTPTPTDTPTNTPTDTPVAPTNTPTDTPVAPTNTPTNTATFTPTATNTPVPPSNLLLNRGFELDADNNNKPDSWSNSKKFVRSAETVHGGSFAGKHSDTTNSNYNTNQTVNNLTAGVTYQFSGWVNIPTTSDAFTFKLQVRWQNASGGNIKTDTIKTYTAATGGWNQASAALVAPAGTVNAVMRMNVSSLNATIFVDDFTFGP